MIEAILNSPASLMLLSLGLGAFLFSLTLFIEFAIFVFDMFLHWVRSDFF